MARMTGFIFQDEYLVRLAKLSDQEVGRLVRALAEYHKTGEAKELAGRESVAFDFIKADIDRIDEQYAEKCENNRKARLGKALSNDNERERTSTNVNERAQDKVKDKVKEKENGDGGSKTRTREGFPPQDDELEDPQATDVPEWIDMLSMYGIRLATGAWQEMREMQEQGIGGDLICWAIEQAVNAGACNWNYLSRVLNNCLKLGCKTRARAEELAAQRKAELAKPKEAPVKPVYQKPQEPKKVSAQNYEQRQYSDDFMAGFADDALAEARRLHAERARQTA